MQIQSHGVGRAFLSVGALAVIVLALAACGGDSSASDAGGGRDASNPPIDSGHEEVDSGQPEEDAGAEPVDAGGDTDAGDTDAGDTDAGIDPDAGSEPVCAPPGIGAACEEDGSCQTGLRCYTGSAGDFCSVDRAPDCGGFAHTVCPASAPYCLRPIGSSLGACATEEEAICICAVAADKIQAGEGTESCPTPSR